MFDTNCIVNPLVLLYKMRTATPIRSSQDDTWIAINLNMVYIYCTETLIAFAKVGAYRYRRTCTFWERFFESTKTSMKDTDASETYLSTVAQYCFHCISSSLLTSASCSGGVVSTSPSSSGTSKSFVGFVFEPISWYPGLTSSIRKT